MAVWGRRLIPGWLLIILLVAGCSQAPVTTPEPVTLRIAGSTSMQPVLFALTSEYSRQHPSIRFDLRGGGSSVGEERADTRQVALGASSLPTSESITMTVPGVRTHLSRTPIGLDALAIIVHPSNELTDLTLLNLRDLYSGDVIDWEALGSNNGEILLVSREDGSGSRALFEQRVMGDKSVSLTAVVMPTSADVVNYVALNPQAIGYVSRAHVLPWLETTGEQTTSSTGKAVRVVPVEGLLPTLENVRSQQYRLIHPLFLVSRGQPQGQARLFIDFVLSPAGQAIVQQYHAAVR